MFDDNLIFPDHKPSRADALRNRELLLNTARQLFLDEGVGSVTMSAIAQAANVGKGTLYRHFPDKAELCHALLDQEMLDLQERTLRRLRGEGTPVTKLVWFMEQAVRFVTQNTDLLCEASHHTAISILQHPAHLWWRQTIVGLLEQIHFANTDLTYTADVLYVMLDVQTIRFQLLDLGYDLDTILTGLRATVERLVSSH